MARIFIAIRFDEGFKQGLDWIKRLTRKQKLELIEAPERIGSVLPDQEDVTVSIVKVEMDEITKAP